MSKKRYPIRKSVAKVDCLVTQVGVIHITHLQGREHIVIRKGANTKVAYCDND